MGKHSKETKAPRRHVIVDKVPVIAAIIIAGVGSYASIAIATLLDGIIAAIVDSYPQYPERGPVGIIIGAAIIMLLYKLWFRPEFEGQCIGGKPGKGFLLGLIFIAYFAAAMLIPVEGV